MLSDEFVTLEDGSGLVHCAPGHGQTDHYVGQYYSIPFVSPVDEQGRFTDLVPDWKGRGVRQANEEIVAKLKAVGRLPRKKADDLLQRYAGSKGRLLAALRDVQLTAGHATYFVRLVTPAAKLVQRLRGVRRVQGPPGGPGADA